VARLLESQLLRGAAIRTVVEISSRTCAHALWQKLLCRRVERRVLLVRVAALVLLWVSHVAHVWAGILSPVVESQISKVNRPLPAFDWVTHLVPQAPFSDKQSQQGPLPALDWVTHQGNPTPRPAVKPPTIPLFTPFTAKSPPGAKSRLNCGQVESRSSFGSDSDEWLRSVLTH